MQSIKDVFQAKFNYNSIFVEKSGRITCRFKYLLQKGLVICQVLSQKLGGIETVGALGKALSAVYTVLNLHHLSLPLGCKVHLCGSTS